MQSMAMDDRRSLIRRKNLSYRHLVQASRACDKRLHTVGWVPGAWLERLVVVRAEHRAAVERWERGRGT